MYCEFVVTLYFFGPAGALPITARDARQSQPALEDAGQDNEQSEQYTEIKEGGS